MTIRNALASVAVHDLNAAASWYERLLGVAPSFPMPDVAEWHFEGGGGLQVYRLKERAGSCSATLAIDDFDAERARLRQLNIESGPPIVNERVRVVMIKDPEGNSLALAQALGAGAIDGSA